MARAAGTKEQQTELDIPEEGIKASIIETKREEDGSTKRISYDATVKPKDTSNDQAQVSLGELEDDFEDEDFESPQIPKSQLEIMFEALHYAIETGQTQDNFYANVQRLPDPIGGTRFTVSCPMPTDLGWFQFSTRDKFSFRGAVQDLNGHSGGVFNISVADANTGNTLKFQNRSDFTVTAGLKNYLIPNPPPKPTELNPNGSAQPSQVESSLMQFMQRTEDRFNQLLQQINKPPVKSALENAIEQKVLNDILHPPTNNQNNGTSAIENALAQMMIMPVMVEKLGERMFPSPPEPKEPTTMDTIKGVLEIPQVGNALNGLLVVSEQFAMNAMRKGAPPADGGNYVDAEEDENPMHEIATTLIAELESDNPFDANNETLKYLESEFPDQADMIKTTCKTFDFGSTVSFLVNLCAKINPNPFAPFIDIEATKANNSLTWTPERGEKVGKRLQEFYEFARTS